MTHDVYSHHVQSRLSILTCVHRELIKQARKIVSLPCYHCIQLLIRTQKRFLTNDRTLPGIARSVSTGETDRRCRAELLLGERELRASGLRR